MASLVIGCFALIFTWAAVSKASDLGETVGWLSAIGFAYPSRWFAASLVAADVLVVAGLLLVPSVGVVSALLYLLASVPFLRRSHRVGSGCACLGRRGGSATAPAVRNAVMVLVLLCWLAAFADRQFEQDQLVAAGVFAFTITAWIATVRIGRMVSWTT